MQIPITAPTPAVAGPAAAPSVPAQSVQTPGGEAVSGFSSVLATVKRGDTLIGMVRSQFRSQGLSVSDGQAWRLAHQVAADNRIANANRIEPGQQLDMSAVQQTTSARLAARASLMATVAPSTANASAAPTGSDGSPAASAVTATSPVAASPGGPHPILEKTMQRAVERGQLRSDQVGAVRERIFSMAAHYGFEPDDFARLTIMESGGMNPLASNGRCHGIIQFCDGPARGAAAVGYAANPRAILKLDLLQQLDLVDKYFEHTGLDRVGPKVSLDDLYLTVLSPAARGESRRDAPLPIPGPQAAYLHVGQNTRAPITRNSIVAGLHQFSNQLLGLSSPAVPVAQAPVPQPPVAQPPPIQAPASAAPTAPSASAITPGTSQRLAVVGQRLYTQFDIAADEQLVGADARLIPAVARRPLR
ncbi:MAG: LysM peptidoglycan-binding domain-containing protein [Betaproteobacteria bacterium]|nr:LysM peptidoglycan-binding domain-containing protein [Betaproteobacteria bacterium]